MSQSFREVTSYYLCHILLVTIKSLGQFNARRGAYIRVWKLRVRDHWEPP